MSRRTRKLWICTLAIAVAFGVDTAWGAPGTLDVGPPWSEADRTDTSRVEVSYEIKASGNVPQSALDAVQDGVDAWNEAIDEREDESGSAWDFDLVPLEGDSSASSSGGPRNAHHREGHGGGPGNGKGNSSRNGTGRGSDPDVVIYVKQGGGPMAGSAHRSLEDGFVVGVRIQISGSAFGLENEAQTIEEVTLHELGHAIALEHHSNEDDLMGASLGYEDGGPSSCDLDGFEQAHEWLTDDLGADGAYVTDTSSIECEGVAPDPDTADLEMSKVGPATVTVDEAFDYDLTATNHGPDAATEVDVVDTLPEEVTFDSVQPTGQCDEADGVVTCTFAQLTSGQSEEITISVVAPGEPTADGEPLVNRAEVSADEADDASSNNTDEAATEVVEPAQECREPVAASASDDTCGTVLSVSASGDASSNGGVAVSGTGDASNQAGEASCGRSSLGASAGCVAVSGTGDASNEAGEASCGRSSLGASAGCVAVSGTGDASNQAGDSSCGNGAFGIAAGCVAVSGAGDASNQAGSGSCGESTGGIGIGCLAVSAEGGATNEAGTESCGRTRSGAGAGCVAVSGTGDAANEAGLDSCGDSFFLGVAFGCAAASADGEASNDVGGEPCEGPRVAGTLGVSCVSAAPPAPSVVAGGDSTQGRTSGLLQALLSLLPIVDG